MPPPPLPPTVYSRVGAAARIVTLLAFGVALVGMFTGGDLMRSIAWSAGFATYLIAELVEWIERRRAGSRLRPG